jgi:hypothetical protein
VSSIADEAAHDSEFPIKAMSLGGTCLTVQVTVISKVISYTSGAVVLTGLEGVQVFPLPLNTRIRTFPSPVKHVLRN